MTSPADFKAQFAELGFDVMEDVQGEEEKLANASVEDVQAQLKELESSQSAEAEPADPADASAPADAAAPAAAAVPAAKPAPRTASKPATKMATAKKPLLVKKTEAKPAAEGPAAPKEAPALKPAAKLPKLKALPAPSSDDAAAEAPAAPSKPKKLIPAPKPKKAAAPSANAAPSNPAAPKPKGALNAYMVFVQANRGEVHAAHPEMSQTELVKHLSELYKALGDEERAQLMVLVEADKERYAREVEAAGGPAPKKPRVKSAYQLFGQERRPELQKENPKAGMPEVSKLLAEAWRELSDEDKAPFQERSKALKEATKTVAAVAGEEGGSTAAAAPKKRIRPAKGGGGGRKRAKTGSQAADAEEMSGEEEAGQGGAVEEEDDIDRENVDWEAHPATAIVSKTRDGKYVVLRLGCGLHEYGEVAVAAANLQRSGQAPEGAAPCPVTVAMVDDYEASVRAFKRDVHASAEGNELVLDALPAGTKLEVCSFLGEMRSAGGELERPDKKNDHSMSVPMLATCRVMQRLVDVVRGEAEAWRERCERAEAELKKAGIGGPGGEQAVVDSEA